MVSQLPLTIEIPLQSLSVLVNDYVEKYLHTHHNWLESKEVRQIRIRLRSDVRMLFKDTQLITDVPLEIQADVLPTLFKGLVGLSLLDKLQRLQFAISLRFQTRLSLTPAGQLLTETEVSFTWDRKPTAATGLVSLSSFFNPLIERELESLSPTIDRQLAELVNLPLLLENAWQQLAQWEKVEQEPPIWFQFALQKAFAVRNLQIRSQSIQIPLLLQGKLRLCLSPGEPAPAPVYPFQLELRDTLASGNGQTLSLVLPISGLNRYLHKTRFDLSRDGMPFFMQGLSLEARDENWVLNGELNGRWKGIPFHGEGSLIVNLLQARYPLQLSILQRKINSGNLPFRLGLRFFGMKRLHTLLNGEINLLLRDILAQIEQSWALLELPDSMWLKGEQRAGRVTGVAYEGREQKNLVIRFAFEAVSKLILRR